MSMDPILSMLVQLPCRDIHEALRACATPTMRTGVIEVWRRWIRSHGETAVATLEDFLGMVRSARRHRNATTCEGLEQVIFFHNSGAADLAFITPAPKRFRRLVPMHAPYARAMSSGFATKAGP